MRKLEPKDGPKWIKPSTRRQEVLSLSDFTIWKSHMDTTVMKSRRCGGSRCLLCSLGSQRISRWAILGLDVYGAERLMELRERHRDTMQRCYDEAGTAVGVRMSVVKRGEHINAPVDVSIIGRDTVVGRDITNLVATFGLPPKYVGGSDVDEDSANESPFNAGGSMSDHSASQEVTGST